MIDVVWLQEAVGAATAIGVAGRVGLLDRIARGPATVAELAGACGITERGAQTLVTALAGMGLVTADEGRWAAATPFLGGLGAVVADWDGLEQVARTGAPLRDAGAPDTAGTYYPAHVQRIGATAGDGPDRLAERLAAPGVRVLDVGAGAASWSTAILARCDGTATLLDRPDVLAVALARAPAHLRDRITPRAGDLLGDDWGGPYDVVLIANVLHLYDPDTAATLVRRAAASLAPGGRVAVIEPLLDDDLAGPRAVALYATGLLLRTRAGGPCTRSGVAGWLSAAGLDPQGPIDLAPLASALIGTAR